MDPRQAMLSVALSMASQFASWFASRTCSDIGISPILWCRVLHGARLASRASRHARVRLVPQFPNNAIVDWCWGGGERGRWGRHWCGGSWIGCRNDVGRGSSDMWQLDVHVLRRFGTGWWIGHSQSDCRGRGSQRLPRLAPCDFTRVHDHSRLRVHDLETVTSVAVNEVQEEARARLGIHFPPPGDAMVRRLAERQNRHLREASVEDFMRGKHIAARRRRGAIKPIACPQN